MADMLTNTVGVTIFILVFTVLAASGAVISKRMPIERQTEARPVLVLCVHGRLYLMDHSKLIEDFLKPLDVPKDGRVDLAWVARFAKHRTETEDFTLTGVYGYSGFAVRIEARKGRGETIDQLADGSSELIRLLKTLDRKERFVFFNVWPDSLDVFEKARARVTREGFATGWVPDHSAADVTFNLGRGSGGFTMRPQ